MLRRFFIVMLTACCMAVTSCNGQQKSDGTEVVIETSIGDIRIRLFDDTPRHRDNFLANVRDGIYDGVTFHRVIRNFMVQTGDPDTRPGVVRDTTKAVERIEAEVVWPKLYHRRGMVGAARDGDDENPTRASDRFQFYVVTGKTCQESDMNDYETAREQRDADLLYKEYCQQHQDELDALRAARNRDGVSDLLEKLQDKARYAVSDNPPITYPSELRRAYRQHGGAPWLDNEYTVFGEVVEGMKVIDQIQKLKTDAADRPLQEVRVKRAYVVE